MSCGKIKDDRATLIRRSLNGVNLKTLNDLRLGYCKPPAFLIESACVSERWQHLVRPFLSVTPDVKIDLPPPIDLSIGHWAQLVNT